MTTPSVLIVGAGEFGASTAVSLLRTGSYSKVTIIDRSPILPAPDAASCDLNKIVRCDYSDMDYCRLAKEAIVEWNKEDWKGIYHQCGNIVHGWNQDTIGDKRAQQIRESVGSVITDITDLDTPEAFRDKLGPHGAAKSNRARGYHNPVAGWANAPKSVGKLYEWIRELGGEIIPGTSMTDLILNNEGTDVKGVRCADGKEMVADKIIVATGSWTPTVPGLRCLIPVGLLTATGQVIAAIQLSEEDALEYADIPVTMNMAMSGFYSFPPNETGLLKIAIHGAGYLSDTGVPRTATDPDAEAYTQDHAVGWIPREAILVLRDQLRLVYPGLATMPITYTRMCWYSDTPDGNWVIDYHPSYPSLLIATGGAGHAFKFLPIMGDMIRQRLEGTLDPTWTQKWSLKRTCPAPDPAREDMIRKPLILSDLATQVELMLPA